MQFTFVMNVYREPVALVQRALVSYKAQYPTAHYVVVGDGAWDADLADLLSDIPYVARGKRHKTPELGHLYTQQWCREGLRWPADVIFKIDPDSEMHHAFRSIPDADYFGRSYRAADRRGLRRNRRIIWGACIGFSRQLLERFLSEGLLDRPDLAARSLYKQGQFSEDVFLSRVCEEHEIPMTGWGEVRMLSQMAPSAHEREHYAVTAHYGA